MATLGRGNWVYIYYQSGIVPLAKMIAVDHLWCSGGTPPIHPLITMGLDSAHLFKNSVKSLYPALLWRNTS